MCAATVQRAQLMVDARNTVGECPVWHSAEQALYWVDIAERTLYCHKPSDGGTRSWVAPEMLACIAPGAGAHAWIAGAQTGVFALDTSDQHLLGTTKIATVEHAMPGMRFNDGRCDRQGRFIAGTMLIDMTRAARVGCIFKLQADGSLVKILQNFITPNGMAFSPDGRTMYLSDSHPAVRSVWAYDYDTENGVASNARPFMDMGGFKGRPDGAAMDVDGCYWICGNDAGLVHRYTPRGELDFSVEVPASKPSMCAFGGKDLRTLYITTIRPSGSSADDLSGGVFAIDLPDIQGMPEARCSIAPASRFSQHTHPA